MAKKCLDDDQCVDVRSKKKGQSGQRRLERGNVLERIREVPLNQHQTIWSLACAVNVPKSSLHDMLKRDRKLKRISSTVKPLLTEQNKLEQLKFCLSMLDNGAFQPNYGYVHMDEKWFYMTKVKVSYYLVEGEDIPYRSVKSKRYITKVMFPAAVAHPSYDPHRKITFDGKIGIWSFVEQEPAKWCSKNRPWGAMETKPINADSKVYAKYLRDKVLPAIRSSWPKGSKKMQIKLQQDNATPHGT